MHDVQGTPAMQATLQYLLTSDIPAEHKGVLIEALTLAMRTKRKIERNQEEIDQQGAPWEPQEAMQLEFYLSGKIASSWQHADELLMQAASQLHRSARDVRAKATELGLGVAVDYSLAKKRSAQDE
jgi:hypothetical protein